jgi:hypothetical protein
MYAIKNEETDRLFSERSDLIRRTQSPIQVMEYLEINKKFHLTTDKSEPIVDCE